MLRRATRQQPTVALTVGVASVLLLVTIGVSLFGSANASTSPQPSSTPSAATSAPPAVAALGAAAGDESLGLTTPYFDPAPTTDPAAPGVTINAGADQPDPFIATQGGRYYLFTSQDRVPANVPVRSGTVLGQWGPMTDALPDLPAWAESGNTWAPDVRQFGTHYILYFTAQLRYATQIMCIGDAISSRIDGPYISNPKPFVCQLGDGGSIDPRSFVDADGTPYLIWKSDENSDGPGTEPTHIFSQRLSADGEQLLGQPTVIFSPDQAWQGRIVEAPDLVLVKGAYDLFYSGGWFNQPGYAIGVARCSGPAGPCGDISPTPLLATNAQGAGPGEESVFTDADGVWLLYNPYASTLPNPGPPRPVDIVRLGFGPDGPYLAAPFSSPAG